MTSSGTCNPESDTGYRQEQLACAFDRVRHSRDWRGPIRAVIPAADRSLVEKAVLWFMNTAPAFESIPGDTDRLMVTAPGSPREPSPAGTCAPLGEPNDDPWGFDALITGR